jgi:hypothetical protein
MLTSKHKHISSAPMQSFTWLSLPMLPRVPKHFVDLCRRLAREPGPEGDLLDKRGVIPTGYRNRSIIKNGVELRSRTQTAFELGDEWRSWVKENLHPNYTETSGRLSCGLSPVHGAHADTVLYRLFYLIDPGSEQTETVFYVKPGHGLLYGQETDNLCCDNLDELVEIERVKFPVEQWILFNGQVLHGVDNVYGNRININVTIQPEDFDLEMKPILTKKLLS